MSVATPSDFLLEGDEDVLVLVLVYLVALQGFWTLLEDN